VSLEDPLQKPYHAWYQRWAPATDRRGCGLVKRLADEILFADFFP
jgi:hypothetical protein